MVEHARCLTDQARIEAKEKGLLENKTKFEREKEEVTEIRACNYDLEPLNLYKPFIDTERFKVQLM